MNFYASGIIQDWQGFWTCIPIIDGEWKKGPCPLTGKEITVPCNARITARYDTEAQARLAMMGWFQRN